MTEENKNTEVQPEHVAENASIEADSIFGDAARPAAEAAKSGGLSRNAKGLIIGGCVLIALGCGMLAVLLLPKDDAGEGPDTSALLSSLLDDDERAGVTLGNGAPEEIDRIEIGGKDGFTVERLTAQLDAAEQFGIVGYEGLRMDQDLLSTLVNNGSKLTGLETIEEHAADLGKYGLADPKADVTLHYIDNTDLHFLVGDPSPLDQTRTYCAVGDTVYLVQSSLVANYQKPAEAFLSTTVLEEPDAESYPIVQSLRVSRKDLDWDIYLEYDYENADDDTVGGTASTHTMLEPIFSYLTPEKSSPVTNGMFGLTAQEIVEVRPTEADLAKYGLADPFCTVVMQCDDGNSYTLTIGDAYQTAGGTSCYYTYLEGEDIIWGISSENDVWATVQPGDITSANIFVTNVWDIGELSVSGRSGALAFECEGTGQDDFEVRKDGAKVETERFRLLYRFLLNIYGEELYIGELPEGEPDAEVKVRSQSGRWDYTISFYKISDLKTVVARDGVASYVIRTSCLDTLDYNVSIFDDASQTFRESWQ